MTDKHPPLAARNFPTAEQDATTLARASLYAGPESAYRLAFTDTEFLLREELRPVRMQLELLKPEMVQQELGIKSTIVIFGSARVVPSEVALQRLEDARASDDSADKQRAARLMPISFRGLRIVIGFLLIASSPRRCSRSRAWRACLVHR